MNEPSIIEMLVWVAGCCVFLVAAAAIDAWLKRRKRPDA